MLNGLEDLHTSMWFLYCWKQDNSTLQPCRRDVGNVFDPWRNPFCQYTLMSPVHRDCHNWWVECPWYQRPRRGLWNRKCQESAWLDHIDDRPKLDLLQVEEGEGCPHLPLQNAQEEQIPMIIRWQTSLVMATGIRDSGELRGDWHRQD